MDLKNRDTFFEYIKAAIENDKIQLPTLPEVAIKVRRAVNSGTASDGELARLIASDPALSVRLLQVANSPLYRARQKVENLQVAITRLGHNTIRNVVISLAMKQIFRPSSHVLESYFQSIWQHSVNIAGVARALATRCRPLDPDLAMLAGLIHQIGKLPILTVAEKFPELMQERWVLDEHLEHLHPAIGQIILETWDLPESLSQVPGEYRKFDRDSGPLPDYVDVVQVAHLESRFAEDRSNTPDLSEVPAFARLGLKADIEVLELDGVADEIGEIGRMLL